MCPQYFALQAAGLFATFIPWYYLPLFHVICGHKHLHFCFNSQQSSLIKAICIFCKVHIHSQGFLFLFMLNSHTAKQSTLSVLSCHRLLVHKATILSLVLPVDYLSRSIPAAPQSWNSLVGIQRNASSE